MPLLAGKEWGVGSGGDADERRCGLSKPGSRHPTRRSPHAI